MIIDADCYYCRLRLQSKVGSREQKIKYENECVRQRPEGRIAIFIAVINDWEGKSGELKDGEGTSLLLMVRGRWSAIFGSEGKESNDRYVASYY